MDPATSANAAALWVGLHLFLLLTLSVLAVRQRRLHHVEIGDGAGEAPSLARAIRAFGNAAEYIPAALIALVVLAAVGAAPLAIHITGVILFGGRVTHAVGVSISSAATPARSVGMLATWIAYVFAGVALIFYAIL
ncbi:MAG: MAPEG family protein [Phenylobacterium sp.]|uniref:MAPEG family protein n=1 Tax=Phenylobacterium sp. TaxID=1871053 RepID=UPI0027337179|nr:MAPEG family protein [Phenylobacterium sp.]MDP3173804.1 MAPEG family protein [Phenylobacterium sp.]